LFFNFVVLRASTFGGVLITTIILMFMTRKVFFRGSAFSFVGTNDRPIVVGKKILQKS